ncbi:MAG: HAD family hydrolase [Dehalococcoidia bacterium]
MVRAVLFDVDDTLSDWPAAVEKTLDEVLPLVHGVEPMTIRARFYEVLDELYLVWRDGQVIDRIHWMLLVDPERSWKLTLPDGPAELWIQLAEAFRKAFRPVAFADAIPTLEALRPKYQLAVLSNNHLAEKVVRRLGLDGYFSRVLSAEDGCYKPHPRAFSRACDVLGLPPNEIAYVGDSIENDIEGALPAGLLPIWLDRFGYNYEMPAGVHRITTLTELPTLLHSI